MSDEESSEDQTGMSGTTDAGEDDLTMADPVCGGRVEMTSLYSANYRGRTFLFDTEQCRDAFLADPEAYTAAA